MTSQTPFRPPGPLSLDGTQVEIIARIGRVGDDLLYEARLADQPVRLCEYAPAGIVKRANDGALETAEERFADAFTDARTRFLTQAERLAAIDHPALPTIVRVFAPAVGAWLATRPSGAPLADALAAGMVLPPERIMRIAAELADALATLHGHGLTHFDIAPQTVSIASGRVELSDLAVDNRPFIALLGSQDGLVRPGYSPIERSDATAAEPLGPPTDIYAASALLYRLIEGRDPPPWEQRWRDPGHVFLPDRQPYPPAFLAAIRRGLALEPGDRFANGAAWRAALAASVAPETQTSPPPAPPPPMPAANWVVPLLIILIIAALAGLIYFAYAQGWFDRTEEPSTNGNIAIPAPAPAPIPVPTTPTPPLLAPGATVAGRLAAGDAQNGGGQYADTFIVNARGGETLEFRLSSPDFDPVLNITGPGLSDGNDDDAEAGTRDSRLRVTFPQAGRYTLSVTSYDRTETGAYLLQVNAAEPALPKPNDNVETRVLSPATPPRQIGGSISDADYPASAIRAEAAGTTGVSLQIAADGRVSACTVTASSGHALLDSTTCALIQRRFRYAPATRNGQPVAGSVAQIIRWRLPND